VSTVRLQEELSYEDAMKVLGFEPGAIVSPHLPVFRRVETKLGELIETTEDEQVKAIFREELGRLNEALRVVEAEKAREPSLKARGMGVRLALSLFLVACIVGSAWWANKMLLEDRATTQERDLETLALDGRIAVESRNWAKAEAIYQEISSREPDSQRARDGFRSIEEGKEAGRRQKLGFLLGSVRAAIEQRDWNEAEAKGKEVLEMEPGHQEVLAMLKSIEDGRVYDKIVIMLESAEEALRDEKWVVLAKRTAELESIAPSHAQLARLKSASAQGMKILEERRIMARELYDKAFALDEGEHSEEALEALREAIRLADHEDFQVLYKKMSSYTRVLEVPGDYSTIAEALKAARSNDKVRIGPGTYKESLTLTVKVDLEGAGSDKTIIECEAKVASVLLARKDATGSRVAHVTLQQAGIDLTEERYPVVAADGVELSVEDCRVVNGSGHGIAVINGGLGRLRNVTVSKCGWDGLAVYGDESRADVADSRFESNFHHGIDAWAGGSVEIRKSRTTLNGLAGVLLMSPGVKSMVTQCTADRNREVGIMVSNGSQAVLRANRAELNLLGGFLVEGEGTSVALEGNVAEKNYKVGIVVDKRSTASRFKNNISRNNVGQQLNLEAILPQEIVPPPPLLNLPPKEPVGASGGNP
jgi:tetratricopeptide (TPR) repeat protein